MSIRFPLMTVLDYNDAGQTGATSVAGGVAKTFNIPQDTDNVVVKLTASVIAGGVSATFQTTDDGGTTWYDVGRTSIVSNTAPQVEWLSIPVIAPGITNTFSSVVATGSVQGFARTISTTSASTLGVAQVSGLPLLSTQGRIFLRYTNAVTSTDLARVQVKVNSQDDNH